MPRIYDQWSERCSPCNTRVWLTLRPMLLDVRNELMAGAKSHPDLRYIRVRGPRQGSEPGSLARELIEGILLAVRGVFRDSLATTIGEYRALHALTGNIEDRWRLSRACRPLLCALRARQSDSLIPHRLIGDLSAPPDLLALAIAREVARQVRDTRAVPIRNRILSKGRSIYIPEFGVAPISHEMHNDSCVQRALASGHFFVDTWRQGAFEIVSESLGALLGMSRAGIEAPKESETPPTVTAQLSDPDAPYRPAEWFRIEFGVKAETTRTRARRGKLATKDYFGLPWYSVRNFRDRFPKDWEGDEATRRLMNSVLGDD